MKKLIALLLAALMVASLAACGSGTPAPAETKAAETKAAETAGAEGESLKLGIIPMDLSVEFFSSTVEGAQAFCDDNGYELIVFDGANDPSKQVQGLENLTQAGCKGIDLRALDPNSVQDAMKEAIDKGVFVATYPDIEGRSAVLLYDDYMRGVYLATEAAKWINEKLGGEAEVAYLIEPLNDSAMKRIDGFNDVLAKECPNAKIVNEAEGLTPDIGMASTESMLQANPNIKVILSSNDSAALGAFEAVTAAGKDSDDFFIGGIDGDASALEKIKQGTIYRASVCAKKLVQEQAYEVMENIANACLGKDYQDELVVEEFAVTAENVEEYLAKKPFYLDK